MTREADQAGWDAVWVGDSVVAKPRLEAMTTLAYMAGITNNVRLGTAVLLPSLRQPVIMAQLLANVDQISKGRLIVGVGVGWSLPSAEAEWAACGMDHKRRARRLEEQIELWRELWSGVPVTREGPGYTLREHTIGPLPWNREGPPIWITAGNRGEIYPAQLSRFGKMGDGIITTYIEYEECVRLRELGSEALERHGRPNPDFPICVYTTVRMDDDVATAQRITDEYLATYYGGSRPLANRGGMGLGPADAVIATFKEYEQAGVTDLCVRFSGEDQLPQLERFSEEVLPAFRKARAEG